MSPIRVVAILPAFGRTDAIGLVAFLRQHCPATITLTFLLIDNGNPPELSAKFAALSSGDCHVIRLDQNLGGAGAFRNGMLQAAEMPCDFIWLLDDDVVLNPQTLPELCTEFLRLEAEGCRPGALGSVQLGITHRDIITSAGGRLCPYTGRYRSYHVGKPFEVVANLKAYEVHYLAATSLLTRPEVIRTCGAFEPIFIHCDDWEWCCRLGRAGYKCFVTPASVIHHPELESKPVDWIIYYDVRNYLWSLQRHLPKTLPVARLLRRVQQGLYWMHGRKSIARLMALGFRHARTGELLLRNELPWVPPRKIDLATFTQGLTHLTILARTEAECALWQTRLSSASLQILSAPRPEIGEAQTQAKRNRISDTRQTSEIADSNSSPNRLKRASNTPNKHAFTGKNHALNASEATAQWVDNAPIKSETRRPSKPKLKVTLIAFQTHLPQPFDFMRLALQLALAQLRHLFSSHAAFIMEHSCVKKLPFPFFASRRAFSRETAEDVEIVCDVIPRP